MFLFVVLLDCFRALMTGETFICSDCGSRSSTQSKPWFVLSKIHGTEQEFCRNCFLDQIKYDKLPIMVNHKIKQKNGKLGLHLGLSIPEEVSDDVSIESFTFNDNHNLQNEALFDVNVSGAASYKISDSIGLSYYVGGFPPCKKVGEFPLSCVNPPLEISAKVSNNYRKAEKIRFENTNELTYTLTNENLKSYQKNSIKCTDCDESIFGKIALVKATEKFHTEYFCENCVDSKIHVEINDITFNRVLENSHQAENKYFSRSHDYLLQYTIHYSTHSKSPLNRIISMNLIEKEIVPYLQGTVTYPTHTEQVQNPTVSPFRNVLPFSDAKTHDIHVGLKENFLTWNLKLQTPENDLIQYTINCNPNVKDSQLGLQL